LGAPEARISECSKRGWGKIDVMFLATRAAVDNLDLDTLVAVGDGGGQRDVALNVSGADTVDEAVATDLSIAGN